MEEVDPVVETRLPVLLLLLLVVVLMVACPAVVHPGDETNHPVAAVASCHWAFLVSGRDVPPGSWKA